jgi:uncharacterized damage-inducible protein DinB
MGRLKKVKLTEVCVQPVDGMHSVYQQVHHIIAWKQTVLNRLSDKEVVQIKIDSEQDWPTNPKQINQAQWNAVLKKLDDTHNKFVAFLKSKDDSFLDTPYRRTTFEFLVNGIIEHDIYHAGQLGLAAAAVKK